MSGIPQRGTQIIRTRMWGEWAKFESLLSQRRGAAYEFSVLFNRKQRGVKFVSEQRLEQLSLKLCQLNERIAKVKATMPKDEADWLEAEYLRPFGKKGTTYPV